MKNNAREEILNQLNAAKDTDYKEFNCKLIPGVDTKKVIGVRIPKVRDIAKKLARGDYKEYIKSLPKDCMYEERMIHGMVIGYGEKDFQQWKKLTTDFVPKICDWATCDSCSSTMKIVNKNLNESWDFLKEFCKATGEYEKRFGVVMIMDYFIREEWIDKTLVQLEKVNTKEYYVMMAVTWAISVCYVKFPEKTEKVLAGNRLDDKTQNKAIQKIRESYRVSKEDKERLKELKRK